MTYFERDTQAPSSENPTEPTYINLEPHWKGLREWATNGLRRAKNQKERNVFGHIINTCEHARLAARPNTDWEGPTWPENLR
jgi:hypothetical protein